MCSERERLRHPLPRGLAVVDDEDVGAAAGVGHRLAGGILRARSRCEVTARMRSSSVIILSRTSERTRAISTRSDAGLVRKSSAPASRPATRSVGLVERGDHHHGNVLGGRIGLEAATHLEAVHVRHHHVEQHEIAFVALADRRAPRRRSPRSPRRNIRPTSCASSSRRLAGTSSTTRIRAVIGALPPGRQETGGSFR